MNEVQSSVFSGDQEARTCRSLTFLKVGGSGQLLSLDEASRSEYRPGGATSTGDVIRERELRSVRGQDIVVGNSEVASPRLHTMPLAGGL